MLWRDCCDPHIYVRTDRLYVSVGISIVDRSKLSFNIYDINLPKTHTGDADQCHGRGGWCLVGVAA